MQLIAGTLIVIGVIAALVLAFFIIGGLLVFIINMFIIGNYTLDGINDYFIDNYPNLHFTGGFLLSVILIYGIYEVVS